MQLVFYDRDSHRNRFLPLSFNRPLADLRIGVLTFAERWAKTLGCNYSYETVSYLQPLYDGVYEVDSVPQSGFRPQRCTSRPPESSRTEILIFFGLSLPSPELIQEVEAMSMDEMILSPDGTVSIWKTDLDVYKKQLESATGQILHRAELEKKVKIKYFQGASFALGQIESFVIHNGRAIAYDFGLLSKDRLSHNLNDSNKIKGERIFVESGVVADYAIFNTETGPIYLGKNSVIQEGAIIRGPFALGEGAQVKLGAFLYPNVSAGPYCRIGGELNTSVLWGYSNKGHHGYMGSSIIGAGCNWGAGTSNSNMKNSFGTIRIRDYDTEGYRDTGLRYLGVIMGDYSRSAIQAAFNSGSVIGLGCNQLATGLSPKFLPNFTWMNADQITEKYRLESLVSTLGLYFQHLGYAWEANQEYNVLQAIQQQNL